jgi:hypothetical protein
MGAARVIPTNDSQSDGADLVHHPDGWYWVAEDGRQEIGPFSTRLEALADRDSADEAIPAEGESLEEVENELNLATWIDPETGSLAEGPSAPHLEDH